MQFVVQMTCQSCVNHIKKSLEGQPGINAVEINLENEQVIVESSLPSFKVKELIEETGRRAVLTGYGSKSLKKNLGSAVCMIERSSSLKGVVRFVQSDENECVIEGTIDGLLPGLHGLHIHEFGDISASDCSSCGQHFNPFGSKHGGPNDSERHVGDLGNIESGVDGRAMFILQNEKVKVSDIIGRSIVISEKHDDLGKGLNDLSLITGNSGKALACGVIARSAGLFENPKRICQCDGISIWDERDKPLVGPGRRS